MADIHQILEKHWGYKNFRPLQQEVIEWVLAGNDTLALLPTGGGKSICFQVPALALDGICIVISPLIALMKDQVENLKKRGIKATALYSGMSKREIDITLDNCVYGDVQFLYCSPERLKTDIFIERVKKMRVGLLAIDEAHCISQWGYDFRPPYLEIAQFRALLPGVPCIALTATATEKVCRDIQEKLQFSGNKLFRKSFARFNLSYSVIHTEHKEGKLLHILNRVPGSAVVYCKTRQHTKIVAEFLQKNLISADYYHAGLDMDTRSKKQHQWITGSIRVIVATNAFGMGIDKPDVRTVIHMEMPDSPEAYYQEAGRAGRDEHKAYAVLLYHTQDKEQMYDRLALAHPSIADMQQVYQALANYFQLATDSGFMQEFELDISAFCKQYSLETGKTHFVLKKLENQGLIQINEAFYQPSRLFFCLDHQHLYPFQVANRDVDDFIKLLLRMYGAELFEQPVRISEHDIARRAAVPLPVVEQQLRTLVERGVVEYAARTEKPTVLFLTPRKNVKEMGLNARVLQQQKEEATLKATTMLHYAEEEQRCRTLMLLAYFDEQSDEACGVCDYCVKRRKLDAESDSFASIRVKILELLFEAPQSLSAIAAHIKEHSEEDISTAIRTMLDAGEVALNPQQQLYLP